MNMVSGVYASLVELPVMVGGYGRKSDEAPKETLVPGPLALGEKGFGMIRVLEVPVPIEAAGMAGHEVALVIDAERVGISLEREPRPGVLGGDRVMVGIEGDAERGGDPELQESGDIEVMGRLGEQVRLLLSEELDQFFSRFAVDAYVGHLIEANTGR